MHARRRVCVCDDDAFESGAELAVALSAAAISLLSAVIFPAEI